jgi:uncharacterized protein with beta-barrel porin domain
MRTRPVTGARVNPAFLKPPAAAPAMTEIAGVAITGLLLPVIPVAISIGVVLADPAAAATVINHNASSTVFLPNAGNYPSGGPFSIGTGVSITGAYGVLGTTLGISLENAGSITGTAGDGVSLNYGGTVQNDASGGISGTHIGVYTGGNQDSVDNRGVITGASGDAVSLYHGGNLINEAGGTLAGGYAGAYLGGNGFTATNAGVISGGSFGVLTNDANTIVNQAGGSISGDFGVQDNRTGVILNAGSIGGGSGAGVSLYEGQITNQRGGQITGATGIAGGGTVTVTNSGVVTGRSGAGVSVNYGQVNNLSGGVIQGPTGVYDGAGAVVYNAGTIASTNPGGTAIAFGPAGGRLTLASGAAVDGAIDGGGSTAQIELTGSGTLAAPIENFGPGSALEIDPGADWNAMDHWAIASVTNRGVFQAGRPGTPFRLTGDYTQTQGGTLLVAVTPFASTDFEIAGSAHLAGAVTYAFAPGFYEPHDYQFLTATGGVTGSFATASYGGAVPTGLSLSTQMGPSSATLALSADPGAFTLSAAAAAIDPPPSEQVVVAPADESLFSSQLQSMAALAQQADAGLLAKAATAPAGGWAMATGDSINQSAGGGAPGYSASGGGFLAGIGGKVGGRGTSMGIAAGYDSSWLTDNDGGKASAGTVRVGLYAAQTFGRFTLAADFLYGHANSSTTRPTGAGMANGKEGADSFSGGIQAGTEIELEHFVLNPAAGLLVGSVNQGGFSETGGGYVPYFAVSAAPAGETSVEPFASMGVSRSFSTPAGVSITPSANVGYQYQAGDTGTSVALTAPGGAVFNSPYNKVGRSMALLAAGVTVARGNWAVFAHYSAQLSGTGTLQMASFGVEGRF